MSASRSFIDVLVGKLTAYVDASSRPAPTIQTPSFVLALTPPVVADGGRASRAYTGQLLPCGANEASAAAIPWYEAVAHNRSSRPGTADSAERRRITSAARPSIERTAIQLLHRLGASELSATSSDAEIRSAYRRLLRACHPDAHPHASEAERAAMSARLRAVLRAWSVFEHGAAAGAEAA